MARLKITIEGEMSPEEVKRYIVAAWANLPHEVAVSEFTTDATGTVEVPPDEVLMAQAAAPASAPAPTPEPVVAAPAKQPEVSLVDRLCTHKKLSGVLAEIMSTTGATEIAEIVETCRFLQSQVPILERLGAALEDRVTRTFEGMK